MVLEVVWGMSLSILGGVGGVVTVSSMLQDGLNVGIGVHWYSMRECSSSDWGIELVTECSSSGCWCSSTDPVCKCFAV